MEKKTLFAIHSDISNLKSFKEYVCAKTKLEDLEIVWDEECPDILFATEQIYSDAKKWKQFMRLYKDARVTVFYTIEALSVDFNLFDIGFCYDNTIESERYCQVLPPEDYYLGFIKKNENDITDISQAALLLKEKKFCNFLYSNWNAHPFRDKLFYALSDYKKVDSLGRHLNNVEQKGTGYIGHSGEVVGIKSNYKFSIACENAFFPGYTTEKMLTSLEAHTIPIYFGNKDACLDVNPNCFINCMEFANIDDIVRRVKDIDQNDELWCSMISQPWYLDEQIRRKEQRRSHYYKMLRRIFTDELSNLSYKGDGTAIYNYYDFMNQHKIRNKYQNMIKILLHKFKY